MEKNFEELRLSRPKPPVGGDFTLSDSFYFTRRGIESIVEDEVHFYFISKNTVCHVNGNKWTCCASLIFDFILNLGDPAVLFRGAGVVELTDSHQH